jgi:hypothetical protein
MQSVQTCTSIRKQGNIINFDKDPRLARKLAKEQQALKRKARRFGNDLEGKDHARLGWNIELDNFDEEAAQEHRAQLHVDRQQQR